jgi:hypothetical protein
MFSFFPREPQQLPTPQQRATDGTPSMDYRQTRLARALRHPFTRAGIPMILFVGLGSYGLSYFVQGRHEIERVSRGKRTLTQRQYDIEEDYKKTMSTLMSQDYELVPIERPKDE